MPPTGQEGHHHPINAVALGQRKMEVVRLLVENTPVKDTAAVMGLSEVTIYAYLRDPEVRKQIGELNSQVLAGLDGQMMLRIKSKQELIDEIATEALAEMRKIITDPTAHVSVKAKMIDSALDRCPEVSRTKKLDVTSRQFTLKGEDLLLAAVAAREIEEKEAARVIEEQREAELVNGSSEQDLPRD